MVYNIQQGETKVSSGPGVNQKYQMLFLKVTLKAIKLKFVNLSQFSKSCLAMSSQQHQTHQQED